MKRAMSRWLAPAKINLFLRVLGRRDDGYHELQTVFQLLDFGDEVDLRVRDDGVLRRTRPVAGVAAERDLALRAARLLARASGTRLGAEIGLRKRIPMGAGLGGGSSNAATVLVALDRLWALDWGVERLAALGLELGADVPVFVRGRSAWAEGIGERLQSVTLDEAWYLVVNPGGPVSTAQVFADSALTRNSSPLKISDFLCGGTTDAIPRLDAAALIGRGGNDCEPVARALCPGIGDALDWLAARAPARMSGTGACVFALFRDQAAAYAALAELPPRWHGVVARGLRESPLLARDAGRIVAG